jgi:hypothetical protein
MAARAIKGGFNFASQKRQRPLFVSKSVAPLEHHTQVSFFMWLDSTIRLQKDEQIKEDLRWIHSIPNGAHVHPATARKLVAEGLKKGVLDISVDAPRGKWSGLRLEFKRAGNKPTPEQTAYISYLGNIGIKACVCYTWMAAAKEIVEYFSLTSHAPIPK